MSGEEKAPDACRRQGLFCAFLRFYAVFFFSKQIDLPVVASFGLGAGGFHAHFSFFIEEGEEGGAVGGGFGEGGGNRE